MELKSLLLTSAAVSTNPVAAWSPPPSLPPENRPTIVRQLPSSYTASLNRLDGLQSYGLRRVVSDFSSFTQPSKTTSLSTPTTLIPLPMEQHHAYARQVLNPGHLFDPEGPKAADVVQGEAGDCYLLALLAGLAEHRPEIITDAIRPADASDTEYLIDYFEPNDSSINHASRSSSKKTQRIFDTSYLGRDNSPLYAGDRARIEGKDERGNKPLFHPSWVKVFENWFAKVSEKHELLTKRPGFNGIGYGGWATIPYQMLTGEEMEKVQPRNLDHFREVIERVDHGDILVLVSGKETFSEYYIPSSHSFAIMKHEGDKITLYNPMGREVCLDAELLFKCTHTVFTGHPQSHNSPKTKETF